jgi:competence protein ComFC
MPLPPWLRSSGLALRRAALDLVYPGDCAACHAPWPSDRADDQYLCVTCERSLARLRPPFCTICAEPFPGEIPPGFSCPNCLGVPHAFDFAIAAWQAEGIVRDMVHAFKYDRRIELRQPLGQLAHAALRDERFRGHDWILVPVPLHHTRLRERTFNQAAEIAGVLHRLTGFPISAALRRVRATSPQASLGRAERLKNLKDAFALRWTKRGALVGRHVMLIDDVFTSGATAQACADILKTDGHAAVVAVVTVARA